MEGWKELDLREVSTKAVENVNTAIPVLHLQSGCECLSSRHHVESLCTLLGSKTNKKSLGLKKRIKYVFPRSFKKQIKLSNTKKIIFWALRGFSTGYVKRGYCNGRHGVCRTSRSDNRTSSRAKLAQGLGA